MKNYLALSVLIGVWFGFLDVTNALPSPFNHADRSSADPESYEYIVVGSGAGGGPLASRLARAGHSVLLIESGDDQGNNDNYTIPAYQALVSGDPKFAWDFFVNHYQDQTRAQRDPKYSWRKPDGTIHVGPNPPAGSQPLGILYPRAGTLGGCTAHNALIWITPHASDWDNIARLTGDASWSSSNMAKYLRKIYEWLSVGPTDPTILLQDLQLTQQIAGGATVAGKSIPLVGAVAGVAEALLLDPNTAPSRDTLEGFFQVPLIQKNGQRNGPRDFIIQTIQQGYPLTLKLNRFVTKINFDQSGAKPRASGVEFLDGPHLYRASPLSGASGKPGRAIATKEVIVSGGTYNTVQLLQLSGVGPRDELQKFGIPLVKHVPALGRNMQDRYEVPVVVRHERNFSVLDGCTFTSGPEDECYRRYKQNPNVLALRGAYATDGLAAGFTTNSDFADDKNIDLFTFAGPVRFIGYFPGWGPDAIVDHNYFSWYSLKAHTRNRAGTVQLRSSDPLDPPLINFNHFDTGTTANGADQKDLGALVQAVNLSRKALSHYSDLALLGGSKFVEVVPGPDVQTDEEIGTFAKDVAWGHHACCTVALGPPQEDDASVLDSKFRVKGIDGLRVVDASVFPEIPGIFIQAPIYMISEKAADDIISGR